MSRPPTTAKCLADVAEWLDLGDKAINMLASIAGYVPPVTGSAVQGDRRLLAEWLRQHPDVDAAMYACLDAVDVR